LRAKGIRQLLLEQLEDRSLLTLVFWDAGGDGVNWTDPLNWSVDSLPGSNDDVQIDVAGTPTIQIGSGAQSIASLFSNENTELSRGTLSLTQASEIHADLTLSGGILDGSGDVTVTSSLNWAAGQMRGTGKTIIPVGSTLTVLERGTLGLERRLDFGGEKTFTGRLYSEVLSVP